MTGSGSGNPIQAPHGDAHAVTIPLPGEPFQSPRLVLIRAPGVPDAASYLSPARENGINQLI